MPAESRGNCDLSNVILKEHRRVERDGVKPWKHPKRVLHFSDGTLEEYSSEDERDTAQKQNQVATIDPKSLNWIPWVWYQTTHVGTKVLDSCDYMGEWLANFFGITSPKYQFEIDEYHRKRAQEEEMMRKEDLEMGGWNEQKRNNLIKSNKVVQNEKF